LDVFGGGAALLTGTPWVISERTSSRHHPRSMQWWLRNAVGRHANAVVANSEVGLDRWEESGPERFVIRNAVAFAEIDATPPDTADYGSSRVIVFAGRLTVEKNVLNLIAALREVMEQRDAVALFCGEGPMEDEIRAAIAAAGLTDRVRLLGYVDNLPAIVKRADVVVAPSWYEGHPNVSTDAAACGCPLVVSDIPAHGWLSDNAALFAPPGDPRAIAAAILQTLDDPAAARARGLRAREIVREWSVERAASSYLNLYRELRAKRAGS
jgi:glycosyltransferase involved in cell wall biosynthesis